MVNCPNQIAAPDDNLFRILQLTDFHSDVSEFENERTRADVQALVLEHRPHFLAVTGDIWCGDGHPDAAPMWMARDLAFLASLETPWAFTWGNHDYAPDFGAAQRKLQKTPYFAASEMSDRGECHIEVVGAGKEAGWDILFANSMQGWNLPADLDWIRDRSEGLASSRGRVVPAVLFFHIPLRCYQTAIDSGRVHGIAREDVLFWGDEAGSGLHLITSTRNIRACFCGHSHRNDCWFEEDGVLFAYGRSTGYGGYGDDVAKGAKLITLDLALGTLSHTTVLAGGAAE